MFLNAPSFPCFSYFRYFVDCSYFPNVLLFLIFLMFLVVLIFRSFPASLALSMLCVVSIFPMLSIVRYVFCFVLLVYVSPSFLIFLISLVFPIVSLIFYCPLFSLSLKKIKISLRCCFLKCFPNFPICLNVPYVPCFSYFRYFVDCSNFPNSLFFLIFLMLPIVLIFLSFPAPLAFSMLCLVPTFPMLSIVRYV